MLVVSMSVLDKLLCMEKHRRFYLSSFNSKRRRRPIISHQDPYALVYILDPHTGLCKFQIGNNKTKTFDKNIKPNFNSEFQFLVRTSTS